MSNPLPPPPPGQPAPMGASGAGSASNKNLYTILAWALFPPIGSLIFLFVGKDDPDVKWNAANAVVVHGAAFIIWIIAFILGLFTFGITTLLWDLVWFVIWVIGLILALQAGGKRFAFPGVQGMANQYVTTVEGWAK
jgi:uncharacterized membrane protein